MSEPKDEKELGCDALLAELDSTFELFERVAKKEKDRFKGTGLDGHLNLIIGCCREAREKISSANSQAQPPT